MSAGFSQAAIERAVLGTMLKHATRQSPKMLEFAHFIKSKHRTEVHEWLSQPGRMVEVQGSSNIDPLLGTSFSVTNKLYDRTMSVNVTDMNGNESGSYQKRFDQFGAVTAAFPSRLLTQALIDGTTDTCYDGAAFFSSSHPARGDEGGVQDNLLDGTGTTASALHTDLGTAIGQAMAFKGENGEPFYGDFTPSFGVVCHPNLMMAFSEAIKAPIIAQTSNVNVGIVDLYANPHLSDADDWYLLGKDDAYKPLILQELEALTVKANDPFSDSRRLQKSAQATAEWDGRASYAFWQSAIKMVNE